MVGSSGSGSQLNALLQQAVSAISAYRGSLTSQLPVPVSSLGSLSGVTNLDTALAAKAATYILQQLSASQYQQVSLLLNASASCQMLFWKLPASCELQMYLSCSARAPETLPHGTATGTLLCTGHA